MSAATAAAATAAPAAAVRFFQWQAEDVSWDTAANLVGAVPEEVAEFVARQAERGGAEGHSSASKPHTLSSKPCARFT